MYNARPMKRFLAYGFLALFLAACGGAQYAFPLKAVSSDVLKTDYKGWKNQLASNKNYYFSMLVPNEWKVLQTSVGREPEHGRG